VKIAVLMEAVTWHQSDSHGNAEIEMDAETESTTNEDSAVKKDS